MAGLEVVVRPVVFPNIRPVQARFLAPPDDPAKGVATLSGQGGQFIELPRSEEQSAQRSKAVETERTVDVERVYQKVTNPDGSKEINRENYVDVERAKKITLRNANDTETPMFFAPPLFGPTADRDNIEIIVPDKVIPNPEERQRIEVYHPPDGPGRTRGRVAP